MSKETTVRNNAFLSKAATLLLALSAVTAIMYAMIEPMNQRMDALTEQVGDLQQIAMAGVEERAAMQQRFQGIETQFRDLREVMDIQFQNIRRGLTDITRSSGCRPCHDEQPVSSR